MDDYTIAGQQDIDANEDIEDNLGDPADEIVPFTYSITAYGADYPIDSLVKRLNEGSIIIPSFQRRLVWNIRRASRFIESLLLGLPVPGIFLSREHESQKLLVIDGQQRLRSLQYFYVGRFGTDGPEFSLRDVQSPFLGVTYNSLSDEHRRRLDDSILHATIVKQEEPSDDDSSIYHIFERLNTGGVILTPQEIRACIYHGKFNDILQELNELQPWRAIYGPPSAKIRDQELILRFFALYHYAGQYQKPMKGFLNKYMGSNRNLTRQSRETLFNTFAPTISLVLQAIGTKAFKPRRALNAAVFDAVMVGIAKRLQRGPVTNMSLLDEQYKSLLINQNFVSSTETGTADEENVKRRLTLATQAFADVP